MSETLLGFHRVAQQYGIGLVQPLVTRSVLGTARQRGLAEGHETRTWPLQYQPADNFRGHFEFGLKYERLHFEFFSRLFAGPDGTKIAEEIAAWLQDAPTGSYARRAAFFYEWFTGQTLAAPDTAANVGYVDAIDAKQYLVAQTPERVRRWRVNNNLPGLPDCCPLVYLGGANERAWLYDVTAGVKALDDAYGPELLLRSAAWLTFKESRASFALEHEADKEDRVQRFAAAIGQFSGRMPEPLSTDSLLALQKAVLGPGALRLGVRCSPVFVGQSSLRAQIVHYIAPSEALVEGMLAAVRSLELRTRGAHTVARAAAVAFAFVYLHPLTDGNGRIHRFLLNHLLAADKAVAAHLIIPVSATMAGTAQGRADYDRVLERLSGPFMQRYADGYRFGAQRTCPDGVVTNFEFTQTQDAQHVWRYPDLSEHARYFSHVLRQTVEHGMAQEALALRQYDSARAAIKNWVEMPDQDADRIIRSLQQERWNISHKLRKAMPQIFEEGGIFYSLHPHIVAAVRAAFEGD